MSDQAITWGGYLGVTVIGFLLLCVVWTVARWAADAVESGDL